MVAAPPTTAQVYYDAGWRFALGFAYFGVITGIGSAVGFALLGEFGVVVAFLASVVGVFAGGVNVARGIGMVVGECVPGADEPNE
jgi:hypothetical protein